MQIVIKCQHCSQVSVTEDSNDLCLEIDFMAAEIKAVCRQCKKFNKIALVPQKASQTPIAMIGVSRY